MKKNKKGHFVLFNFDASIDAVREMERQMGLHEDVLRFMTLRTDDLPEDPSVMLASRNERGGRHGRDRERGRGEKSSDEVDLLPKPEATKTSEPAGEAS